MKRWFLYILVAAAGVAGCGGDSNNGDSSPTNPKIRSPEEARRELGELNIQYDRESFLKSIEDGLNPEKVQDPPLHFNAKFLSINGPN